MSKYVPIEEMNESQLRAQLDAAYLRWDDIKKNGCSDPAWPDGVNLNLVRNHIIYFYRFLRERFRLGYDNCSAYYFVFSRYGNT